MNTNEGFLLWSTNTFFPGLLSSLVVINYGVEDEPPRHSTGH